MLQREVVRDYTLVLFDIIEVMPRASKRFYIPDDLVVANTSDFADKMAAFASSGASGMHAIFDFDRTLTVKRPDTQDEVTTWAILREHLPNEGQADYQRLFEKYRALELSSAMTQQDAIDWWSSTLNLFVKHRINLAAVEETFLDRASIRPGTRELFELFAQNNIPTVILSAGVRQIINIWCRKYDVHPTLVMSTDITVDDNNIITGWQKNTLVHVLNKSEATHPELTAIRKQRPKVFVVGDSLDDAAMAADGTGVIKVRILDPRGDEIITEQAESKTFERFDSLIKVGTFSPLRQLVGQMTQ